VRCSVASLTLAFCCLLLRLVGVGVSRPPKFDPTEIKIIYLRCFGGEAAGASSLAPKVGPLGLVSSKQQQTATAADSRWLTRGRGARKRMVPFTTHHSGAALTGLLLPLLLSPAVACACRFAAAACSLHSSRCRHPLPLPDTAARLRCYDAVACVRGRFMLVLWILVVAADSLGSCGCCWPFCPCARCPLAVADCSSSVLGDAAIMLAL
jgi:hypothetical protein